MMRTEFFTLTFATLLAGAALVGPAVVAPALAQDMVVEHYDEDTGVIVAADEPAFVDEEDGPVVVEESSDVPPADYEPPVYGWIGIAPQNCGTFKYWNGEHCADARFDPSPSD